MPTKDVSIQEWAEDQSHQKQEKEGNWSNCSRGTRSSKFQSNNACITYVKRRIAVRSKYLPVRGQSQSWGGKYGRQWGICQKQQRKGGSVWLAWPVYCWLVHIEAATLSEEWEYRGIASFGSGLSQPRSYPSSQRGTGQRKRARPYSK